MVASLALLKKLKNEQLLGGEAAIICEPFWRVGHELVFLLTAPHLSWLLQAEEPVEMDGQLANLIFTRSQP